MDSTMTLLLRRRDEGGFFKVVFFQTISSEKVAEPFINVSFSKSEMMSLALFHEYFLTTVVFVSEQVDADLRQPYPACI